MHSKVQHQNKRVYFFVAGGILVIPHQLHSTSPCQQLSSFPSAAAENVACKPNRLPYIICHSVEYFLAPLSHCGLIFPGLKTCFLPVWRSGFCMSCRLEELQRQLLVAHWSLPNWRGRWCLEVLGKQLYQLLVGKVLIPMELSGWMQNISQVERTQNNPTVEEPTSQLLHIAVSLLFRVCRGSPYIIFILHPSYGFMLWI